VDWAPWISSGGSVVLLAYVLFKPEGKDTLLYWFSSALSIIRWGRRKRAATYIQKESEKFRASLNRDVEGLVETPLKIEWIKDESREEFLKRGQCVVRIKDHGARHKNLTAATLLYVRGAVVPQARGYLGPDLSDAVDLTLTKKLLERHRHTDALVHFVQNIETPEVRTQPGVHDLCQKLEHMEDHGFMTRIFLREAKEVTAYIFPRLASEEDEREWAKFTDFLHAIATRRQDERAELQFRSKHLAVNIGLIAATYTLKEIGVQGYVDLAEASIEHGAHAIYLCSWGRHYREASKVARRLKNHDNVEEIVECPPCYIMHPFAEEPTPVKASFIAICTTNRSRLATGAVPIEKDKD